MSLESSIPQEDCGRDAQPDDDTQYRLRYYFGDFELYSEWRDELVHVENLAEQLRRQNFHDVTIEAKAEYRAFREIGRPGEAARSPMEAHRLCGDGEGQR